MAEFGRVHLTGEIAWLLWAGARIFFLIGLRNRVMVSAQWVFVYATRQRTDRVIVGGPAARPTLPGQPPVAKPG